MRVPQDVWTVGCDNISISGWSAYDLTTVNQPLDGMAQAAIDLLLARCRYRSRQSRCAGLLRISSSATTSLTVETSNPSEVERHGLCPAVEGERFHTLFLERRA
jgi:hypothetical protein